MKRTPEQLAKRYESKRRARIRAFIRGEGLGEKRYVPNHPWRRYGKVKAKR